MRATQAMMPKESCRERFQALIERHRGVVLKVASAYSGSAEDRRDLAQEILVQLWRAFPGYDPTRVFTTWMYRIALNVAISALRGRGEHERLATSIDGLEDALADDSEATLESDDGIRALYRFIAGLDPLNRAVMLLYLDETSHRDMAAILGISESNVATKLGRLKTRLRDAFAPEGT